MNTFMRVVKTITFRTTLRRCFVFNLKLVFRQRLSSDCEDQIAVILQEAALDYRLDPQLQLHCSKEVSESRYTYLFSPATRVHAEPPTTFIKNRR